MQTWQRQIHDEYIDWLLERSPEVDLVITCEEACLKSIAQLGLSEHSPGGDGSKK